VSYIQRPMGDGPITQPSQDDDSIVVAEVPPSRVDCSALPPDSPWRQPGQVCATDFSIVDMITGLLDKARGALSPSATPSTAATVAGPPVALLAVGAVAAYFIFKKKKR
jgi:hypothetical protein